MFITAGCDREIDIKIWQSIKKGHAENATKSN